MKQPEDEADQIRVVWALSVCLTLFLKSVCVSQGQPSCNGDTPHFQGRAEISSSLRHSSFRRMSMDETVAEYTEAKTTARKGAEIYPIGDDILSKHIICSFVDIMGLDVCLVHVETYSCESNPKLIHPFKMWKFRVSGGRRLKKPNVMREEIRNIKFWEWLLPVVLESCFPVSCLRT